MSFKTELEAIVGDIDSPDYTSEATLYLVEGVKFISKWVAQNPEYARRLVSGSTLNSATDRLDLTNILKVINVTRYDGTRDRQALEVPYQNKSDYTDVNSIYYTSKLDPKYYVSEGTLYIIPTPTNSQHGYVQKIQPDTSVALSDTAVDNFPDELERGVVLYAAKELLRYLMNQIRKPNVSGASALTSDIVAGNVDTANDRLEFDKWFDIAGDYIQKEDVELAQAELMKISAYIQTYSVDMQADAGQYEWYKAQYAIVINDLVSFLTAYVPTKVGEEAYDETAAND